MPDTTAVISGVVEAELLVPLLMKDQDPALGEEGANILITSFTHRTRVLLEIVLGILPGKSTRISQFKALGTLFSCICGGVESPGIDDLAPGIGLKPSLIGARMTFSKDAPILTATSNIGRSRPLHETMYQQATKRSLAKVDDALKGSCRGIEIPANSKEIQLINKLEDPPTADQYQVTEFGVIHGASS
ncbi:hypothetical protein PSTT_04457 [Puccinia striiformis]|uniref:Uncharacterized protein n=1 Tax=Puccinia striiformis TaxID=27350 RepID=A0A2S4VSH5_9BASI|nr:hypothetical protein PSTT_04457 [Puccinia striiformis]